MKLFKKTICVFMTLILLLLVGCSTKNTPTEPLPENPNNKAPTTSYVEFDKLDFFYLTNLSIPNNWYREDTENGFVLIENKTGSEISFSISEYYPLINNISHNSATEMLTTETKEFISFQKPLGNQIVLKYYETINNVKYTVTETQTFNFDYIYTIKYFCEEKYFDDYENIYNDVVKSLKLSSKIKTIPSGYNGLYNTVYNALFMYPRDWKTTSNTDYFTSTYSKTTITVTCSSPILNFNGMDKTTYNTVMQKTVSNFSTASFNHKQYYIDAEGYYTENEVRYIVYNRIYNLSNFSINIIFVSPESEYKTYSDRYKVMSEQVFTQKQQ